jgi:hypothetical protein
MATASAVIGVDSDAAFSCCAEELTSFLSSSLIWSMGPANGLTTPQIEKNS